MTEPVESELAKTQAEYRAGDIGAAAARIARLFDRYPKRPDVLTAQGVILVAQGQLAAALRSFEVALSAAPDLLETLAWAASTALRLDDAAGAERHAQSLCQLVPQDPRAHLLAAKALAAGNRIPDALAEVNRSIELRPDDAEALLLKARLLRRWQLPGLSLEFYRLSLAARPTPAAAVDLAQILLREGGGQAALDVLQSVVDAIPEEIRPYDLIGQAQTYLGRLDEAEASWVSAEKHARDRAEIVTRRAETEIASGMAEIAAARLQSHLDAAPESVRAFYLLTTARKFGPNDLPLVERMQSLSHSDRLSEPDAAELGFGLGKCFDDLGEYEQAMRSFDEANRICNRLYLAQAADPFDADDAGRYTDALIRAFTQERISSFASQVLESSFPLFVVGLPRSGTTLASQILTAHSLIGGGRESSFWPERAIEFMRRTEAGIDIHGDVASELAQEYLAMLSASAGQCRYAVDKNPNNFQFSGLLHGLFPNSRIIHLSRHPLAIALSIWMAPFRLDAGYVSDRRNLVCVIREHARLLAHFHSVLPEDRFLSVRYEAITNEPDTVIRGLFEFLELQPEPACFRPESNPNPVLTLSANQVRHPIHKRSQERWKNYEPWLGELAKLLDDASTT